MSDYDQHNPHPCRYCGKRPTIQNSNINGYRWICECGNKSPIIKTAWIKYWNDENPLPSGWINKRDVLEILRRPIQNCDLSWEECDERFIQKISDLKNNI